MGKIYLGDESSDPGAAPSTQRVIYGKSDGYLYYEDSAGVVKRLVYNTDTAAVIPLTSLAGTNTLTATGPAGLVLAANQIFSAIIPGNNTGATTLNITPSGGSALGAKNVYNIGAACVGGELLLNVPVLFEYDGTQFNIIGGKAQQTTPAFKNRVINGNRRIDQVNAGASQTYTAGAALAYNTDMFLGSCTGANVTGQQVAGTVAEKAYKYTGAASVTAINDVTRIESHNIWDLNNTTATLSAMLSNSLLTSVTWTVSYANAADNFSAVTQIATGTFTITSTPTVYQVPVALGANAKNGVQIQLSVGAQTSGTWQIEQVQLEPGPSATAFDFCDYKLELARCQRYLPLFAPGTNPIALAQCIGLTSCAAVIPFPVQTRTAPTGIAVDNVTHFSVLDATATLRACTNVVFSNAADKSIQVNFTIGTNSLVAGNVATIYGNNASSLLYATGARL